MRLQWGIGCLLAAWLAAAPARADNIDDLTRLLRSDSSHRVRSEAALVLGQLGDKRALKPLLEALRDREDAVRGAAASSLGRLGDVSTLAALEPLRKDRSEFVRGAAERAAARLRALVPPSKPPAPPPPPPPSYFVSLRVAARPDDAARVFEAELTTRLGRLPNVKLEPAVALAPPVPVAKPPPPSKKNAKKPPPPRGAPPPAPPGEHFQLDGAVTQMVLRKDQLECGVRVVVAAMPGHAIRATSTGDASVNKVKGPHDKGAQRDCLGGAADQVAEDLGKFLQVHK